MSMSDSFDDIISAIQPGPKPSPGNLPGRAVQVLLVGCWLLVCLVPILLAVDGIELAAGKTGTPGTLTVVSCEALGQGRYDCKGSFTPDDGGAPVPVDASPDSEAGDVTRAQLTPEGDRAVKAGAAGVVAALTMPFLGVGGLGFLPYVIMYFLGVRRGRRAAVVVGFVVTALGTAGVVAGMVASYS
ncbi:hypothetical protein Ppa06_62250 [Planomonospora parontospora subsp. parontospora]|uniref:Uncharacterized protein n=3 Tax=Planomonospora parontospora TaxID=58119 RepID=A0AA37F270_9ACTN|nr:hypothetical protein GCM10010126_05890 [Planomonospora parontospora]GII12427.1 hypothetical protein Ppa06_62250 [Planomonospora parontospora subsp. parontospora]